MLEITKSLETGIPIVDKQHRELVSQLNALTGNVKNSDDLEKTLKFLGDYVVMHFKTELDLMTKCNYPAGGLHDVQHELFVEKFLAFKGRFDRESYSVGLLDELHKFLLNWLVNHIKVSDVAFGNFYCGVN